jgi:hypothetical protein
MVQQKSVLYLIFNQYRHPTKQAGVVKLVDIPDLGSGAARHGGSSPSTRTITSTESLKFSGFLFFIP